MKIWTLHNDINRLPGTEKSGERGKETIISLEWGKINVGVLEQSEHSAGNNFTSPFCKHIVIRTKNIYPFEMIV